VYVFLKKLGKRLAGGMVPLMKWIGKGEVLNLDDVYGDEEVMVVLDNKSLILKIRERFR
jgi:hypothetical protein